MSNFHVQHHEYNVSQKSSSLKIFVLCSVRVTSFRCLQQPLVKCAQNADKHEPMHVFPSSTYFKSKGNEYILIVIFF